MDHWFHSNIKYLCTIISALIIVILIFALQQMSRIWINANSLKILLTFRLDHNSGPFIILSFTQFILQYFFIPSVQCGIASTSQALLQNLKNKQQNKTH